MALTPPDSSPDSDPDDAGAPGTPDTTDATGLLDRAAALVRQQVQDEPPAAWPPVAEGIRERVRLLVIPAEPIALHGPDGEAVDDAGSRTIVSSRVLVAALRRALRGSADHAPERIRLDVDDEQLLGLRIELVVAYGTDIPDVAARVRAVVARSLADLLGDGLHLGRSLDVGLDVVDVVDGDPRLA